MIGQGLVVPASLLQDPQTTNPECDNIRGDAQRKLLKFSWKKGFQEFLWDQSSFIFKRKAPSEIIGFFLAFSQDYSNGW